MQELQRIVKSASDKMRADDNTKGTAKYLEHFSWLLFLKVFEQVEDDKELVAEVDGVSYSRVIESPYKWSDWARGQYSGDELIEFVINELFPYLRARNETDAHRKIARLFDGVSVVMKSGYVLAEVLKIVDRIEFRENSDYHSMSVIYETLLAQMGSDSGWSGEHYTPRPLIEFMVDIVNPQIGERVLDPCSGSGGFLVEAFEHLQPQVATTQDDLVLHRSSLFGQDSGEFPFLLGTMNLLLHGVTEPNIEHRNALERDIRHITQAEQFEVILTNPPFGGAEHPQVQRNFPIKSSSTQLLFMQLILAKLRDSGRLGVVLPESFLSNEGVFAGFRKQMLEQWNVHTIVSVPAKGIWYKDVKTDLVFIDGPGPTEEILYVEIQPPAGAKNFSRVRKPLTSEAMAPYAAIVRERIEGESSWLVDVADLGEDCDLRPIKPAGESPLTLQDAAERLERVREALPNLTASVGLLDNTLGFDPGEQLEGYETRPLSSCLTQRRDAVRVVDDMNYKRVRVSFHGRGLFLRDEVLGRQIKTKTQYLVEAGQFVVAEIDARLGGMGMVPEELHGAIVSSHYFAFDLDESVCRPGWLALLSESEFIAGSLSAKGATNYASVRPDDILASLVPMPAPVEQDRVLSLVEAASAGHRAARKISDELETILQEVRLGSLAGQLASRE
ncbi:N-6 DNA methylase [Nocardioides sp. CN2-186]|uniref:N-6 DNA methylase n=1 Tax=Nocardioides tweenelious TaxID=3156607 RepID=UPI0032B53000